LYKRVPVACDVDALANAWGLSSFAVDRLGCEAGNRTGAIVYYDASGNRCEVDEKSGAGEREKSIKAAAGKACVVYLGGGDHPGISLLWLAKEKGYIRLAEKLNYKVVSGHRCTFQCFIGPNMEFIAHESMPPPEPWSQRVLCKISDGGFSAAVMALGALITFFSTTAFSGTANWAPLGISLVLLLVGLFIGCICQFFYRRIVAPETVV
jgi:hypothetical protein